MRIVTLIENLVYEQGLIAEHGLSIYIETKNSKILFDTGQSGLFIQNAKKLGVKVEEIDSLVLSHGHYDHTGGLLPFLEKNSKAKVYAKKGISIPKYSSRIRFIGTPSGNLPLKERIVYLERITEIADDVFIVPDIRIYDSIDTHFEGLNKMEDDKIVPDEFEDELFLALRNNERINIVTACSHRGITNICTSATEHFKLPVNLILGGFHTKNCTTAQYRHITNYFRHLEPKSIGVCHCTGVEKYADLNNDLDFNVFYNYTGNEVII